MVMPLPNTLVDLLNDIGVNHYRLIGILSSLKEKGLIDSRHERVFALRYGIFSAPHTHREIAEMIGTKKALARKITNQELDKILISAITKIKKEHRNELVAWHKAGYFNRPMFAMYKHRT